MEGGSLRCQVRLTLCPGAHSLTQSLTHSHRHASDLNTGSRVDVAQWCLVQRELRRCLCCGAHHLFQEKALSFFSMDMCQVFKFWAPGLNYKTRFLAFVKLWSPLDFLLWTTCTGPDQAASFLLSTF